MKHKYFFSFFVIIHMTSEMSIKEVIIKKLKTTLGETLERLSKNLSGKAFEYAFHRPLYDSNITSEQKKEIESILKNYISLYNISFTSETFKATTEKISDILKITQKNLNSIALNKKQNQEDILFLSDVDLAQNHVTATINFWIKNDIFEQFKNEQNYEGIKKKNTITSIVLSHFENNYISLKTILEEYCYNNIISIALQKKSIPKKLLLNKIDENNFQVSLDELIESKKNTKEIIEGTLSYNKTMKEIVDLLTLEEEKKNNTIKEDKKKQELCNQEIKKLQNNQDILKKKREKESQTYERELAAHETNFDVSRYEEKITNKKSLLDQKQKELDTIQNSSGLNFLKNTITFATNGKKKEIEELKKDIDFLKKSREETLEQKQREYALFMPQEHAKKMKEFDQNIEIINLTIESLSEETKKINSTILVLEKEINAIKKIKKSLDTISETIKQEITSAENKIFTYIKETQKETKQNLFITMKDFLKKEKNEKKQFNPVTLSSEIKIIEENKKTLEESLQTVLQSTLEKIHNVNNLLMHDNKIMYLILLLFIEEPLPDVKNQNANLILEMDQDFFFPCIETIHTLDNKGTIFADAAFSKIALHIHQKIIGLETTIRSTISFLSTFIILHSFDPYAQKEKSAYFENIPVINGVVNFFTNKDNASPDMYGFQKKNEPSKKSKDQKLFSKNKEEKNTTAENKEKNLKDRNTQQINSESFDTKTTHSQEKNTAAITSQNKLLTMIKNTIFAFFTNNALYLSLINRIFRF